MRSSLHDVLFAIVSTMLLSVAESLRFTKLPDSSLKIQQGKNIVIQWKYEVEAWHRWLATQCIFKRSKNDKGVRILTGKPLEPLRGQRDIKESSTHLSLTIFNVNYRDGGIYHIEVKREHQGWVVSRETSLKVEGKPIFCEGIPPKFISAKEGGSAKVDIVMCGSPHPSFTYVWNHSRAMNMTFASPSKYFPKYTTQLKIGPLQRKDCGKKLLLYGQNSFGYSVKPPVKINVLFKPLAPRNIKAYYGRVCNVEVKWDKQESGLCSINYRVDFLNVLGESVYEAYTNINSAFAYNPKTNNITSVIVKAVTSLGEIATFQTISFRATPSSLPPVVVGKRTSKKESMVWIITGSVSAGILFIAMIIITILCKKSVGSLRRRRMALALREETENRTKRDIHTSLDEPLLGLESEADTP